MKKPSALEVAAAEAEGIYWLWDATWNVYVTYTCEWPTDSDDCILSKTKLAADCCYQLLLPKEVWANIIQSQQDFLPMLIWLWDNFNKEALVKGQDLLQLPNDWCLSLQVVGNDKSLSMHLMYTKPGHIVSKGMIFSLDAFFTILDI